MGVVLLRERLDHRRNAGDLQASEIAKTIILVVKGGELVRKFGREAAVKCAAFQIPIELFLHAHHGSNLFLQQVKTIAAPTQTVPWVRDVGVRVGILFSIPKCAGERIAFSMHRLA